MRPAVMWMVAAAAVAVVAFAAPVDAQATRNTPNTYAAGANTVSTDPCARINVQTWAPPPASRVTTDPNWDAEIPADYASLWNGRDNEQYAPNGFRKGQVFEDNSPAFCFDVANTVNRQVQLMLQTVDEQARLCVEDINPGGYSTCFNDKLTACITPLETDAATKPLRLRVYMDSGSATSAQAFWYRVRVSETTWDDNDEANSAESTLEMWCAYQAQDTELSKFPKDLRSVVPPPVVPADPPADKGAAHATAPVSTLVAVMVAAVGAALARLL